MCGLKGCKLKMGIDFNRASYNKMAAFSLIAGAAKKMSSFSGIKINLSHHVSYRIIGYLSMKYEEF